MNARVSVVIPAYNSSRFLKGCLRSIAEQTLPDVEAIVVDDASTDDTRALVGDLKQPNVTYICHKGKPGPAAARNTGLARACGTYIAALVRRIRRVLCIPDPVPAA